MSDGLRLALATLACVIGWAAALMALRAARANSDARKALRPPRLPQIDEDD